METRKKVNSIIDSYIKNEIVATENGAFLKTINKWIAEERKKEKLNDCTAKSLNAVESLIKSIPNRYPEEIKSNMAFFKSQEIEQNKTIKSKDNKTSALMIYHLNHHSR
ncbi:MAG: hypothetical protein BWY78_00805 [Alphaproteobacteria bacterium ADurb.Bin438]|nr:MAG: hypothetical protein BWY78_00805 [Alphaproteobacteria bacterium ADurb.Bin438]